MDADKAALAALVMELDDARDLRKERVVAADADVRARLELRAALADEDRAARDQLAAESLHAEPFGGRVAAVSRAADAFLVCHCCLSLPDRIDANGGEILPVPLLLSVAFAALHLEDD